MDHWGRYLRCSRSPASGTGGSASAESTRSRVRFDGFDLIRIVAALMVVFDHSFGITGHRGPHIEVGNYSLDSGHLGVITFFVTSGFLVAQSWERDPRPLAVRPPPLRPHLARARGPRRHLGLPAGPRRHRSVARRLLPFEVQLGLPLEHDAVRPGPLPPSGRVRHPAVASRQRLAVDAPVRGVGVRRGAACSA